jgi:hypothetical protein
VCRELLRCPAFRRRTPCHGTLGEPCESDVPGRRLLEITGAGISELFDRHWPSDLSVDAFGLDDHQRWEEPHPYRRTLRGGELQ